MVQVRYDFSDFILKEMAYSGSLPYNFYLALARVSPLIMYVYYTPCLLVSCTDDAGTVSYCLNPMVNIGRNCKDLTPKFSLFS